MYTHARVSGRLGFALLCCAAVSAAVLPAQRSAAEGRDLLSACTDAARQYFGDFEARTEMQDNGARVDGTRTVGGEIYLENRSAYIACAFAPKRLQLVEFSVDGEDQLASLQRGTRPASSGTPNYDRPVGGVLPDGSSFSAATQIACRRKGTSEGRCDAGVVREGHGNGFVMVFWPDGGSRVLRFENGTISGYDESEADGGARLTVKRRGDVQIVEIGDARFEVFDALITGG